MPQASVETARVPYASTHTASMAVETKPLVLAHVFYRHRYRLLQLVLDTLAVVAAWHATFELRVVVDVWMPPTAAFTAPVVCRRLRLAWLELPNRPS